MNIYSALGTVLGFCFWAALPAARAAVAPAFSCVDGEGEPVTLGVVLSDEVDRMGGNLISGFLGAEESDDDTFGVVQVMRPGEQSASLAYTVDSVTETSDLLSLKLRPQGNAAAEAGYQELRIPPSRPERSRVVRADGERALRCEAAPARPDRP
ncbi:MAG: hypothetical protein IT285_08720 [Bdellovibrionales bacterium]|nr:hypothetical protein [Bdellovibrionales bacterium]